MRLTLKEQSECGMFCPGCQKWHGMLCPGMTKTAWDVLSGVTKTAWDVLSRVANLCGMFCTGVKKWHGMFCLGMFCPAPTFTRDQGGDIFELPPYSVDLDPIDTECSIVKRHVSGMLNIKDRIV